MANTTATIKLWLGPNNEEERSLDGQSKICNWLFNRLLEQANQLKADFKATGNNDSSKIVYTKRGLRNLVPRLKLTNRFLTSVHSSPLKNTALRLSKSINAFQKSRKGLRRGKAIGWPKFKSFKREFFSLEYDEPLKGYKILPGFLQLSLGLSDKKRRHLLKVAMPDSRILSGKKIRGLRIVKEGRSYFAVFTVMRELPQKKPIARVIALDPNHKNLSYGVDNAGHAIEIEAPYWLKNFDKRMDELKSKRDRCKRKSRSTAILNDKGEIIKKIYTPSRRYQRYHDALQKALSKRRDQTKTYRYTVANALCKHYNLISIGDYTPHGGGISKKMRRGMNNRSVIGEFKEALSWCGEKSGKHVSIWNEKGSTRTCHACLTPVPDGLPPKIRSWTCSSCDVSHIRDENSAINGIRLGKEQSPRN